MSISAGIVFLLIILISVFLRPLYRYRQSEKKLEFLDFFLVLVLLRSFLTIDLYYRFDYFIAFLYHKKGFIGSFLGPFFPSITAARIYFLVETLVFITLVWFFLRVLLAKARRLWFFPAGVSLLVYETVKQMLHLAFVFGWPTDIYYLIFRPGLPVAVWIVSAFGWSDLDLVKTMITFSAPSVFGAVLIVEFLIWLIKQRGKSEVLVKIGPKRLSWPQIPPFILRLGFAGLMVAIFGQIFDRIYARLGVNGITVAITGMIFSFAGSLIYFFLVKLSAKIGKDTDNRRKSFIKKLLVPIGYYCLLGAVVAAGMFAYLLVVSGSLQPAPYSRFLIMALVLLPLTLPFSLVLVIALFREPIFLILGGYLLLTPLLFQGLKIFLSRQDNQRQPRFLLFFNTNLLLGYLWWLVGLFLFPPK